MLIAETTENQRTPNESLVGVGTVVVGDISFSGGLRVDGEVRGSVRALDGQSATLIIGEKGRVDGNIEVTNLVIHGSVTGWVHAIGLVELRFKARVKCDVEYSEIVMHPGAVIQGSLLHRPHSVQIERSQCAAL